MIGLCGCYNLGISQPGDRVSQPVDKTPDIESLTVSSPVVKFLGEQRYAGVFVDMQRFTDTRTADSADEIWVLQHSPVYTLGQAGDPQHILNAGDIPIVQSDRGGQVTYHGPGQIIVYPLLDLRRYELGVRSLVELLEDVVILLLLEHGICANSRRDAPGVYVDNKKIAALGLRIRRSCSFHGLSLNVDMDLEPFNRINPCGYAGLEVTQISNEAKLSSIASVSDRLVELLVEALAAKRIENGDLLMGQGLNGKSLKGKKKGNS